LTALCFLSNISFENACDLVTTPVVRLPVESLKVEREAARLEPFGPELTAEGLADKSLDGPSA